MVALPIPTTSQQSDEAQRAFLPRCSRPGMVLRKFQGATQVLQQREKTEQDIFFPPPHFHSRGIPSEASLVSEEAEGKPREWAALSPGPAASESPWACSASCKCPPGPAGPSRPPAAPGAAIPARIQRRLHHNCFLNSEAFEVKAKVCFYA